MKRGREDGGGGEGCKVYVWNLPFTVDWAELKRIFRAAGSGKAWQVDRARCIEPSSYYFTHYALQYCSLA